MTTGWWRVLQLWLKSIATWRVFSNFSNLFLVERLLMLSFNCIIHLTAIWNCWKCFLYYVVFLHIFFSRISVFSGQCRGTCSNVCLKKCNFFVVAASPSSIAYLYKNNVLSWEIFFLQKSPKIAVVRARYHSCSWRREDLTNAMLCSCLFVLHNPLPL